MHIICTETVYNIYTHIYTVMHFVFLYRKVSIHYPEYWRLEYGKQWESSPRVLSRRLASVQAYELQLSISPDRPKRVVESQTMHLCTVFSRYQDDDALTTC